MARKGESRSRYRLENFISRGGSSLFLTLFVVLLIAFIVALIIRIILLSVLPQFSLEDDFITHLWRTFLQIIDPGGMVEEEFGVPQSSFIMKVSGFITTMLGVVVFSMVIAFLTTQLETMLYNFRKGRSRVVETGHTLILGWNERVLDTVRELIIANESEKRGCIVILADEDKEEMDDTLAKEISDRKTTAIVTRSGKPASLNELRRVNVNRARSVIILSAASESSPPEEQEDSDRMNIKSMLAVLSECSVPVVVEVFNRDKRKIVESLEYDNVVTLDSEDILGKLLVLTSRSPGLATVYNEVLSFDGAEIYFDSFDEDTLPFGELVRHYPDGVPMGVLTRQGDLVMRPDPSREVSVGDSVIILASDDSAVQFRKQAVFTPGEYPFTLKKREPRKEKELIIGWHSIGETILREFADFLPEGSSVDILIREQGGELQTIVDKSRGSFPHMTVNLREGDPLNSKVLESADPFSYDNVIILSQDLNDFSPERVDSDTLLILLLLRKIMERRGGGKTRTRIITQVLNSENDELIRQNQVDDYIISNRLMTMIISQISENMNIKLVYDRLFSEEGSEIYLKPAALYFDQLPVDVTFGDLIGQASKRDGEICLGYQDKSLAGVAEKNFGIILNPPKSSGLTLAAGDYLVVLAENEL